MTETGDDVPKEGLLSGCELNGVIHPFISEHAFVWTPGALVSGDNSHVVVGRRSRKLGNLVKIRRHVHIHIGRISGILIWWCDGRCKLWQRLFVPYARSNSMLFVCWLG
jgi:hypothetical protein